MRAMTGLKLLAALGLMFWGSASYSPMQADAAPAKQDAQTLLFVSKNGNDANDGTKNKPFATLEKARDAVRERIRGGKLPPGGVKILIRGGEYRLTHTFELDERDSGTPEAPITYQAFEGEKVTFVGGDTLSPSLFRPVSDPEILAKIPQEGRGSVVQIDLKAIGLTDYGKLGNHLAVAPELFASGNVMTLARWPNSGFTTVDQVVAKADDAAGKGYTFTYKDGMPHAWTDVRDAWMLGYWGNDWATNDLEIQTIDQRQKRIETYKGTSYAMKAGQRFYFYNVLEELDMPGEWVLNRETGMLYVFPPAPLHQIKLQLSLLEQDMIRTDRTSNVIFSGFTLEISRGNGITIQGGEHNLIRNMTIRNMGGYAVKIDGGRGNGVYGCSIYGTGNGGISLNGGDSGTLTPAGNYADNNDISDYSRIKLTYAPAVEINGVGNRATHNNIHDAPHFAIQFRGNDHLIAYNDIYDVVKETADASAIYSGRSFVWRGNAINYNYIHDIAASNLRVSTAGIYLDDYMSGVEMRGNVFYNIGKQAFKLANGRENVVENNLVIDSGTAVAFMARNYKPGEKNYNSLMGKFDQVPYRGVVWSERYPTLPNLLNDEPLLPKRNVVRNNIFVNSGPITGDPLNMQLGTLENNVSVGKLSDIGTVDLIRKTLELNEAAEAFAGVTAFQPIPLRETGVQISGLPHVPARLSARIVEHPKNGDAASSIGMDLNGNRLVAIHDIQGPLKEGSDYIVRDASVVLQKAYLSTLPEGPQALVFSFSGGSDAFVTVLVKP